MATYDFMNFNKEGTTIEWRSYRYCEHCNRNTNHSLHRPSAEVAFGDSLPIGNYYCDTCGCKSERK